MCNLVLSGFMASGKTAVGREVARRLGRPFVDMDAEIAARAGRSIPQIFETEGEAAFRRREAALCTELSAERGLVIATGGGTLVDPQNRERMMSSGIAICLNASAEEIERRLEEEGQAGRPLLDDPQPRRRIDELLARRRAAYRALPWQIDTNGRTVEQVAAEVIALAAVHTRTVHHPGGRPPGGSYPVYVGRGILDYLGGLLGAAGAAGAPEGGRVAVVSNPVVAPLYAEQALAALRRADLAPFLCTVPDGEEYKTLATVEALYEQFLVGGLERGDTVLALGGGVTGDLAGFAAATYLRGVRFVPVPTTLLAMVDASVGAKTGVNLPQGKNLVGAFWQPALVAIDPSVLTTLDPEQIRCGTAEAIKQGLIGDPALLAALEAAGGDPRWWWQEGTPWIARALGVKAAIVEQDPFEQGRRAVLNLGHTVGHALEQISGYTLLHGQAVAIGMAAAARIAAAIGWADDALVERVEGMLTRWGLPIRPPASAAGTWTIEAIAAALDVDKKRRGGRLRWALPRAVGQVEMTAEVPERVVRSVLEKLCQAS